MLWVTLTCISFSSLLIISVQAELLQVHIIFRHGDRTNKKKGSYPKDPHINETYFPFGPGELTNKGKLRQFELGTYFRSRYDEFLGDYTPGILEARSSGTSRTKTSLLLLLAGLFPPVDRHVWKTDFSWQPISFEYDPPFQDSLFFGFLCPKFRELYKDHLMSREFREEFANDKEILDYVSENTGVVIDDYKKLAKIYIGLTTEQDFGLELPEWTKKVYPKPMEDLAVKYYDTYTANSHLKRVVVGKLLKKIIDDSRAKISGYGRTKLLLYSGHESTVAFVLRALGVFNRHVPPFGSYVLVELHQTKEANFGLKFFYHDNTSKNPETFLVPGCEEEFCPIDRFASLLNDSVPREQENFCGYKDCNRSQLK